MLNKEKSNKNSSQVLAVVLRMARGNPGAMECIMQCGCHSENLLRKLVTVLDTRGVNGTKLYMLWNDCCSRNVEEFEKVIDRINSGDITDEHLHENLNRTRAVPFE